MLKRINKIKMKKDFFIKAPIDIILYFIFAEFATVYKNKNGDGG
jgi:hypothetical protein